jgi:hypothetical protein
MFEKQKENMTNEKINLIKNNQSIAMLALTKDIDFGIDNEIS